MRTWVVLVFSLSLTAPGAWAQTLSPADQDRAGDILLYRWTTCRMDAAKKLIKSTLPTEAIPLVAAKSCRQDRENWIESQISAGITRGMLGNFADKNERCLFEITTGYVDLVRSGASSADIKEWALRHPQGCAN